MKKEVLPIVALLILSAVLLGFQLGKTGLIDPDEPFYSLTAKEMLLRHDASTPFMFGAPQFEKPILFYWVLYGLFRWLGVSEFSARLGPVLAGMATVLITYFWARLLFRRKETAFISAAVLAVSAQFVILSRIVLTDIFLCLFVTAALFCFSLGERFPRIRALSWHLIFVFSALGFLTKGPLGFMIPFAGILSYALLGKTRGTLKEMPWLSGLALFALIGFPWFLLMTWKYGVSFLQQTFLHENLRRFFVAEHRGSDKALFYPIVLILGFFPWSGFLIPALAGACRKAVQNRPGRSQQQHLFLFLSFVLPFIFFCTAKSKLMSYIFPVYPIVAILAGAWMFRFYRAIRLGVRLKPALIGMNAILWGVFPAGLVAGAFQFSVKNGVAAPIPLFFIALTMVPLLWTAFYLFCRKKFPAAFVSTLFSMLFLSCLCFGWLLPHIESAISSKQWAKSYQQSGPGRSGAGFLTSKMFLRGASFYTENPSIGVFSEKPRGGFYTSHPISIISDADGLSRMAAGGSPVYLLLREKEWKFLNKINNSRFSISILEATPPRRWMRLDYV